MLPPTASQVIDRLERFFAATGWSRSEVARRAGLSESTIRKMGSADWNPTRETLLSLEKVVPPLWKPGDPPPNALAETERRAAGKEAA